MARPETLTRYHLSTTDPDGYVERMNVLLDMDNLVPGTTLTLEEFPDRVWKITAKQETIQRASIKRGWNNNI